MDDTEKLEQLLDFEQLLEDFVRERPEHADCYKILAPAGGEPQVLVKSAAYEPFGHWLLATGRGDPEEIRQFLTPAAIRAKVKESRPLDSWLKDSDAP